MLLHIFNTTFKSDDKQSIRADSMLVPWICSFYNPSSCWIMSSFLDWFFPFISLVPQIDKSCRKFDANNKPFDRTRSLAVHQNLVDRANENAWIKLGFSSAKYFRQYEKDKKNYDWIPEDSPTGINECSTDTRTHKPQSYKPWKINQVLSSKDWAGYNIGLELDGAAFLSACGYHPHIGMNTILTLGWIPSFVVIGQLTSSNNTFHSLL